MAVYFNYCFFYFSIIFTLFVKIRGSEEGCGESEHGISCCSKSFTRGDNQGDGGEMFIQASQYFSSCQETCKNKFPTESAGITESLFEKYTSGDGINKNKCWCEFGVPKLSHNENYQTCMFPKPDAQKLVRIKPGDVIGSLGYNRTFWLGSTSETDPDDFRVELVGATLMMHERDMKQCCADCKKKYPDTQMMNWHKNFIVQDENAHLCECLKPLGERPAVTRQAGFVTGLCFEDSANVDGEVGEMRQFNHNTVEEVAEVAAENEDECCQKCNAGSNDVDMFEFSKHHKQCDCFKEIPGMRPATYEATEFAAHVCA